MTASRIETLAEGVTRKRKPRPSQLRQSFITIYALAYPLSRKIRYIGKSIYHPRRRLSRHLQDMKAAGMRPVAHWLRGIVKHKLMPIIIVLEHVAVGDDWAARERYWIAAHRKQGAKLLNLTDGGEGLHGHKFAGTEHARKIGAKLRRGATFSCERCGAQFWRKPHDIKKGDCRFCSRACYQASLRGVSKPVPEQCTARGVAEAVKARRAQTHCKRGHPLSGENLFITSLGGRACKECRKMHKAAYRSKSR